MRQGLDQARRRRIGNVPQRDLPIAGERDAGAGTADIARTQGRSVTRDRRQPAAVVDRPQDGAGGGERHDDALVRTVEHGHDAVGTSVTIAMAVEHEPFHAGAGIPDAAGAVVGRAHQQIAGGIEHEPPHDPPGRVALELAQQRS